MRTRAGNTPWQKVLGVAVLATIAITIILLAFIWPSVTAEPKNIPVAVAGSSNQTQILAKTLNAQQSNLFDVTVVASRQKAVELIEKREVYGAIIPGSIPEIITASANGPAVSQIFAQIAQKTQIQRIEAAKVTGKPIPPVKVTDVVPLSNNDERGTVLAAIAFPLAMGGMLGGAMISFLVIGAWRRAAAAIAYALVGGLVIIAVLQGWLGIIPGEYLLNSAAAGLTLLGTSMLIIGLHGMFGGPGIGIGALITMLIGNPISGSTLPHQFLLEPWGAIGQWLVPGAGGTLLRDVSYFPDASIAFPLYVLLGWTLAGALFIALSGRRQPSRSHIPTDTLKPRTPINIVK
jgi:hypothetical protein